MTIIDSERKRPDPREEVARAIYEARNGAGACPWRKQDRWQHEAYRGDAKVALSRLNQLGMLNEAYFEAIAEKRK